MDLIVLSAFQQGIGGEIVLALQVVGQRVVELLSSDDNRLCRMPSETMSQITIPPHKANAARRKIRPKPVCPSSIDRL